MMACPDCHRVRRPDGLHICLAAAMSRRLDSGAGHGVITGKKPIRAENYSEENASKDARYPHSLPRAVSTYTLPGGGPAAMVWNSLVKGGR